MHLDFLLNIFGSHRDADCLAWRGKIYSYARLMQRYEHCREWLLSQNMKSGETVLLHADFSPDAVAMMLALIENGAIIMPVANDSGQKIDEFRNIAQIETEIFLGPENTLRMHKTGARASHELYQELRRRVHPGLVLFSSGSSGTPKGTVHDLVPLLEKFRLARQAHRAIAFLLFDHIGGFNTMFHVLANGGCLILVEKRDPDSVLDLVARFKAELLPASPTFLNLLLLSEAYKRHDLGSLRIITYGTEPMPETTLQKLRALLPGIALQQTYGMTELGILRSKSLNSDSLWVKIGGEGVQTRVVDGMLQIKSVSAMLGYLNAPSPFTSDGWLMTGDCVEQDGEYLKILGRASEIINVGGQKVYPAEVESVIQRMPNVEAVTVFGQKNAIVGSIVCARVRLVHEENPRDFLARLKLYCGQSLQRHQIPAKVEVTTDALHSDRFKKLRAAKP